MKILQIISGNAINGAVLYCKFLTQQLIAAGHEVTIMVRNESCLLDQPVEGAEYLISEMNRSPFEIARMSKWLRKNRVDLIHTHMSRGHAFGVLLKLITGIPVIATAHSQSFQLHWKMNDYVIANSDSTRDYHLRVNGIANDRIETVYCFSDLDRFLNASEEDAHSIRRSCRAKQDDFVIAMVGEVVQRKGQIHLLEALPKIIDAVPSTQVWMIGRYGRTEKYVRKLRKTQKRMGLAGRVKRLGLCDDVQNYMRAADVTVVPSLEEPLGLVALESLATGTPVVAARIGGLPEIVDDCVNGHLVNARDSDAMANRIIGLARHPKRRLRMGQAGRKMITNRFDPLLLTKRVEQIYHEVIARRQSRAA